MTNAEIYNLIVAIIGAVTGIVGTAFGVFAFFKAKRADEANERYQEVQKQFAELQLIAAQKANIVLEFQTEHVTIYKPSHTSERTTTPTTHQGRQLMVKNVGNVDAYNIKIAFESTGEYKSPASLDGMEPIPILAPGIILPRRFWIGMGESLDFYGTWS